MAWGRSAGKLVKKHFGSIKNLEEAIANLEKYRSEITKKDFDDFTKGHYPRLNPEIISTDGELRKLTKLQNRYYKELEKKARKKKK